jgi:hypothetical protein
MLSAASRQIRGAIATGLGQLRGRTFHASERAEDAAITGVWPQQGATALAFVEVDTRVRGHGLIARGPAARAGERGMQDGKTGCVHLSADQVVRPVHEHSHRRHRFRQVRRATRLQVRPRGLRQRVIFAAPVLTPSRRRPFLLAAAAHLTAVSGRTSGLVPTLVRKLRRAVPDHGRCTRRRRCIGQRLCASPSTNESVLSPSRRRRHRTSRGSRSRTRTISPRTSDSIHSHTASTPCCAE